MWGVDPLFNGKEPHEERSADFLFLDAPDPLIGPAKKDDSPLAVLRSDTDIGLPNTADVSLSWVFTKQEQQQLESWWHQAVDLKRGRPSKESQLGLPTDTRTVLGASGKLRLRLTEWISQYYKMNLREFSDLTGFPYSQLLYWNQGRSTPTMVRFYALMAWFKEGDVRDFFQLF